MFVERADAGDAQEVQVVGQTLVGVLLDEAVDSEIAADRAVRHNLGCSYAEPAQVARSIRSLSWLRVRKWTFTGPSVVVGPLGLDLPAVDLPAERRR